MGWLSLQGRVVDLVGEAGETGFGAYEQALAKVSPDGPLDPSRVTSALEQLDKLIKAVGGSGGMAGEFKDFLSANGDLVEALTYLSRKISTISGGDADKRTIDISLLGWTPSKEVTSGQAKAKAKLGFGVHSGLVLSVDAPPAAGGAPQAVLSIAGALNLNFTASLTEKVKVIDALSVSLERAASRKLTYARTVTDQETRAVTIFKSLFEAMGASPLDLDAVNAVFSSPAHELKAIELNTLKTGAGKLAGSLSTPIAGGVGFAGEVKFKASIERRTSNNITTRIEKASADHPGRIRLSASRASSKKTARELGLGVSLKLAMPEFLTEAAATLGDLSSESKSLAQKLVKYADLDALIEKEVKKALKSAVGAEFGEAVGAGLFDPDGEGAGALSSYVEKRLKERVGAWAGDGKEAVRGAILDELSGAPWSNLRLGDKTAYELANTALGDVFKKMDGEIDKRIKAFVKNDLGDDIAKVNGFLGELNLAKLGDNAAIQKIEEAVATLKSTLNKLAKRADHLKTMLETAAEGSVAFNASSERISQRDVTGEYAILFTPGVAAATAVFSDAVLAPRSLSAALQAMPTAPDGVTPEKHTETERLQEAASNTLKLDLFGLASVDIGQALRSDVSIIRDGNRIRMLGESEADGVRRRWNEESQTVSASYLFAPASQPQAETEAKPRQSRLTINIRQNDQEELERQELANLLENFTETEIDEGRRAAILAHADTLREKAGGTLKGVVEFSLPLNRAQLAALADIDRATVIETGLQASWSSFRGQDFNDIGRALRLQADGGQALRKLMRRARKAGGRAGFLILASGLDGKNLGRLYEGLKDNDAGVEDSETRGVRLIYQARSAAERLYDVFQDIRDINTPKTDGTVADREADVRRRAALLANLNGDLAIWAKPSLAAAPGFDWLERIGSAPLSLIRTIRGLCDPALIEDGAPDDEDAEDASGAPLSGGAGIPAPALVIGVGGDDPEDQEFF